MIRKPINGLLFALCLCLATPLQAAAPAEPKATDGKKTTPKVKQPQLSLTTLIDKALNASQLPDARTIYRTSVLKTGSIDPVLKPLQNVYTTKDAQAPLQKKAIHAWWLTIHLQWQHGLLDKALKNAETLSRRSKLAEVALVHAKLLDASGKPVDARKIYEGVLKTAKDSQVKNLVQLRLAMLSSQSSRASADLAKYAKARPKDTSLGNRAAVVLGLLNRPQDAIKLFKVHGTGTARFKQEIRLAEWALAAKKWTDAQKFAWSARKSAKLSRDRRYANTLLVESYRSAKKIPKLIDRFKKEKNIDDDSRKLWVALLRETGKVDEALKLFRTSKQGQFTAEMRRELLELCRDAGKEALLLQTFKDLIKEEPARIQWRESLSRYHLEKGERKKATVVWEELLTKHGDSRILLPAANSALNLGLEQLTTKFAEKCIKLKDGHYPALLLLFEMHRKRGRTEQAVAALERMDKLAAPHAGQRMQLAEAYEQIGRLDRAVKILEDLRKSRGPENMAEDLEMHLAWLHSEVGNEEKALSRWKELWLKVESVGRRRYIEDRLMSVASRLGKLADIAIEIEERLADGKANSRDAGLLVQLYTKAGDPVSAAEITEEYMKQTGGNPVKVLVEKARIYVSCHDYFNYERTIRQLIKVDKENSGDYLRQLAMSHLERGKRNEARTVLAQLKDVEGGSDSAEFEAGVLALAGMRNDAIIAYRKGLARYPDRIDTYLLLAKVMKEVGKNKQAIGMFQYLAENAEKDDLFTIAIDGLLNADAPRPIISWARRITFERLTHRHDKMYLYQLISDLSEEMRDRRMMLRSQAAALPIAGERRIAQLRELMDLAKAARQSKERLRFGRRLISLGDIVPPNVYLDLGAAFLASGDVKNAAKTFSLARDLPDYPAYQRKIAQEFEKARYLGQALRSYERVMVGQSTNASVLAKIGELHEQLNRDDLANGLFMQGIDMLIGRQPLQATKDTRLSKKRTNQFVYYYARNVDEYGQYYARMLKGALATLSSDPKTQQKLLDGEFRKVETNIKRLATLAKEVGKRRLAKYPRLIRRAEFYRRLAIACGRYELVDKVDHELLAAFPKDEGLLGELCRIRVNWGMIASAKKLIANSKRSPKEVAQARFIVGVVGKQKTPGSIAPVEASRLFMPMLVEGKDDAVRELLQRVHITTSKRDLDAVPTLFSAAVYLGDADMVLDLGRRWANLLFKAKGNTSVYQVTIVLQRCWGILDQKRRRALIQYVVTLIADNPQKGVQLIYWLERNRKYLDDNVLGRKKIEEMMLKRLESGYSYGVPQMFRLLKPEDQSTTLRFIWPKVAKSQRAYFITQLVTNLSTKIDKGFETLLVESFRDSLAESANKQVFPYYVRTIVINKDNPNPRLAVKIVEELLNVDANSISFLCLHAVALKRNKQQKEALKAVAKAYKRTLTKGNKPTRDYYSMQAKQSMLTEFLPAHINVFLSVLDNYAKSGGKASTVATRRMELLGQQNDPEKLIAAYESALKKYPKDMTLYSQYETQLRRLGRAYERIKVLERMAKLRPQSSVYKSRLATAWRALKHPLKAAQAQPKSAGSKKKGKRPPRRGRPGVPIRPGAAMRRLIPAVPLAGTRPASAGKRPTPARRTATAKGKSPGKQKKLKLPPRMPVASISTVKRYVDRNQMDMGRLMFRGVWRNFRYLDRNYSYIFYSSMSRNLNWSGYSYRRRSTRVPGLNKGGLAEFYVQRYVRPKPVNAYSVLAEKPFGEAEMVRQLRTLTAQQVEGADAGVITDGLAKAIARRLGFAQAIDQTVALIESGRASRRDYLLLLSLLAQNAQAAEQAAKDKAAAKAAKVKAKKTPIKNAVTKGKKARPAVNQSARKPNVAATTKLRGTSTAKPKPQVKTKTRPYKPVPAAIMARVERVLTEMTMSMNPRESGQLRRLAHFLALRSEGARASRLYRWCGTFATVSTYSRDVNVIPLNSLVEEIIEVLKGEDQIQALEAVFRFSAPASTDYYRDQYDLLVLQTWSRVLGPGKALAKCRNVCAGTNDREGPIKRRAALYAARLLAQGGDLDTAIKCLETATCKDVVMESSIIYSSSARYAPRLSNDDMRRLFPATAKAKDWKNRGKWFTRAAQAIVEWHKKGRLDPRSAIKVLAIAAWRQHEAGEHKSAVETLKYVAQAKHLYDRDRLWAADVARKVGAVELAIRMERKQLADRRLLLERVPDLVAEIEKKLGAPEALKVAEDATHYTLHPKLVDHLIRLTKNDAAKNKTWAAIKKKYYPPPKPRPAKKAPANSKSKKVLKKTAPQKAATKKTATKKAATKKAAAKKTVKKK